MARDENTLSIVIYYIYYFYSVLKIFHRRKRKAEKVKLVLGACEEGILIFDRTESIIMNHNADERWAFATRETFSCFLLLSHEWFMIQ